MISISRLLCDSVGPGDHLRYGETEPSSLANHKPPQETPRPVVVWNCTRQCNLNCLHCYASASKLKSSEEIDITEGENFIQDLADFGVPAILFSGGEPLLRKDLFELSGLAKEKGIRVTISTNGTLINKSTAKRISHTGFNEVGISLDGVGLNNDYFRGKSGAYQAALDGIRNCIGEGLRVSLRLTMTRFNYQEIPAIFRLVEEEGIARVCFYHLAYSGRGSSLRYEDLTHEQARSAVDMICEHTLDLYQRGLRKEVLTVSNHADGVYLYLKLREKDPAQASQIFHLLKINGGNNSGIKIGAVDDLGNVHPDQFWWHYTLGNVRQRKFSEIWADTSEPLLQGLRNRQKLLKGRCPWCRYLDLCNGNLRARAEAVFGDIWAEDPACYLTDEEIGLK